jgi:hypothetical protein
MKTKQGTDVCYNVQIAVDQQHKLIVDHEVTTRLLCFAIPGVYMILFDPILPSYKKGSTSDAASYCGSRSRGDGPRGHLSRSL